MAKAGTPRKRTADYDAPPVGSVIGTLNNPGVRYLYCGLSKNGQVSVCEWAATDTVLDGRWHDIDPAEWARLTERWVLVEQPASSQDQPISHCSKFEHITTVRVHGRIMVAKVTRS